MRLFLSAVSLSAVSSTKFCINCKHFIPPSGTDLLNGKCSLYPRTKDLKFLVTGDEDFEAYKFCTTARSFDSMCGKLGKYYEPTLKQ